MDKRFPKSSEREKAGRGPSIDREEQFPQTPAAGGWRGNHPSGVQSVEAPGTPPKGIELWG